MGARATEGTGARAARDLGVGWKISPSVEIGPGRTHVAADVEGPGTFTHLWLTTSRTTWRSIVLRVFWDNCPEPAVEVPLGDFFCQGWGEFAQVDSAVIAVNPLGGLNSYWEMPFRRHARVTLENVAEEAAVVFYQFDYELAAIDAEAGYLHAAFRRSNPVGDDSLHTILDIASGQGHYCGTYLAWGVNSSGWWGEGEVKFFLDDDEEFPTICGTGTEDYFGGAWNFDVPGLGYQEYSTTYLGLPQVIKPDGLYRSQQRFGMYRWHLPDPIRFTNRVRVTVAALGWRSGGRYLPLRDDIASTAVFYLRDPNGTGSSDAERDRMEIC